MINRAKQFKYLKRQGKNKQQSDFQSIKSKFDLPTLVGLPITSLTLFIFSKEEIIKCPVFTIFTAFFLTLISRTGLMYYANYKRKASSRVNTYH